MREYLFAFLSELLLLFNVILFVLWGTGRKEKKEEKNQDTQIPFVANNEKWVWLGLFSCRTCRRSGLAFQSAASVKLQIQFTEVWLTYLILFFRIIEPASSKIVISIIMRFNFSLNYCSVLSCSCFWTFSICNVNFLM